LTPGAFCKKKHAFLDILAVFRLDFSQISFNLVENLHLFLPLTSRFMTFWLGHAQKSNLDEKVTYIFRLFDF